MLGDSLSAAYGIPAEKAWVYLLSKYLAQSYPSYQVLNASISGDTTESGLYRLPTLIYQNQPNISIMILALGANDGLRGLDPSLIESNLSNMITLCKKNKIKVLLVGMYLPPNYGIAYTKAFSELYSHLLTQYKISFIPFMLEGVATEPNFMQEDGLHPNEEGQKIVLKNILSKLNPLLTN